MLKAFRDKRTKNIMQLITRTLRTFSLAFVVFSWRERLRTDRRWWRFSERPSWRPPDMEPPSLPSLRPEVASDGQLKWKKAMREKPCSVLVETCLFKTNPYLSADTIAVDPAGCSKGVDWQTLMGVWKTKKMHKSCSSRRKQIWSHPTYALYRTLISY